MRGKSVAHSLYELVNTSHRGLVNETDPDRDWERRYAPGDVVRDQLFGDDLRSALVPQVGLVVWVGAWAFGSRKHVLDTKVIGVLWSSAPR